MILSPLFIPLYSVFIYLCIPTICSTVFCIYMPLHIPPIYPTVSLYTYVFFLYIPLYPFITLHPSFIFHCILPLYSTVSFYNSESFLYNSTVSLYASVSFPLYSTVSLYTSISFLYIPLYPVFIYLCVSLI